MISEYVYKFLILLVENPRIKPFCVFIINNFGNNKIAIKLLYFIFFKNKTKSFFLEKIKIKISNYYFFYFANNFFFSSRNKKKNQTQNLIVNLLKYRNKYVQNFLKSKYELLDKIHQKILKFEQLILKKSNLKRDFLFLEKNFFIAVGHYAFLDIINKGIKKKIIKEKIYAELPEKKYFFLKKLFKNINFVKKKEKKFLQIFTKKKITHFKKIFSYDPFFLFEKNFFYDVINNQNLPFWLVGQKINYLFKNKEIDNNKKTFIKSKIQNKYLREIANGNFVCVHQRESGYHKNWNSLNPSLRDSEFETLKSSIKYLIDKKFKVIRIGDSSMKKTSIYSKNFYDISHLKINFEDQIKLIAKSKFCIMSNSGISLYPGIFNIPTLYINWVPLCILNWTNNSVFIPKIIKKGNKILNCEYLVQNFCGWSQFRKDYIANKKFTILDNSEIDILNSVKNFLYELSNGSLNKFNKKQIKIKKMLNENKAVSLPKICKVFQKKYNF